MTAESPINRALKKCYFYAKRGRDIAIESIKILKETSDDILQSLSSTIETLEKKNVKENNASDVLVGQLSQIQQQLSLLPDKLMDDVKSISKTTLNITLFGRTMAGKSTLMSVLTHGNGEAIGKGYQRTTQDVREYSYQGITITDVPGIGAFDGQTDTETAFNAAKKADLVLFLITDDGPQPEEANCFRDVLSLGKPVICLINVKADINQNSSLKMVSRDIGKKMNENHINAIKKQFLAFGEKAGQDWSMIKFEFVHLKAAFIAQNNPSNENSEEYYRLSRFEYLERLIADEAIKNGCYYKIKSFIDVVSVPLTTTADILIQQAADNSGQCKVISDKNKKLSNWLSRFEQDGKRKIQNSLNALKNEIKREVPGFTETHYSDKNAGVHWAEQLKKHNIEKKCSEILDELSNECESKLSEIYREIAAELKFNKSLFFDSNISMPGIVDGKSIWNWGVTLISGGLGIAAIFGVPVVGWIAGGVALVGGLLSFLFKSKDKKIAEARQELEKKLNDDLETQFSDLFNQLSKIFSDELITKQVTPTFKLFDDISKSVHDISVVQRDFAKMLYSRQEKMNYTLLNEALDYLELTAFTQNVNRIARIPGSCIAIVSLCDVSNKISQKLSGLLRETIYVIEYSNQLNELVSNTIGINKSVIEIRFDSKHKPEFVRLRDAGNFNASTINRIKLAQQISRMYIMK